MSGEVEQAADNEVDEENSKSKLNSTDAEDLSKLAVKILGDEKDNEIKKVRMVHSEISSFRQSAFSYSLRSSSRSSLRY